MSRALRNVLAAGAMVAGVGCWRSADPPAPPVAAVEPVAVVPVPKSDTPPSPPAPVLTQAPAPRLVVPFAFPDDLGGTATATALIPSGPANPPSEKTTGPRPRISDYDSGEVPLPRAVVAVPVLPIAAANPPKPSPPPERVAETLGRASDVNTAAVKIADRPARPATPTVSAAAPDLPPLARQTPDRASVEDPTAEISTMRAVITAFPFPESVAWFARYGVPDPFEFAEQLKGKLPIEGELGSTPAPVPAAKP